MNLRIKIFADEIFNFCPVLSLDFINFRLLKLKRDPIADFKHEESSLNNIIFDALCNHFITDCCIYYLRYGFWALCFRNYSLPRHR